MKKDRKMIGLEAVALFLIAQLSIWGLLIFSVLAYSAPTIWWKITMAVGFLVSLYLNRWEKEKELEFIK